ncbi:uncharacterized protein DNG_07307 [Cephalotrichum gorgonifer]|uniref:Uncharacterized protein n=1 Tax=Cephalotrichum gorgonifer TaxID=2041049 RepID=A0AAE8SY31_9PEZI|nr:uncharacterized protein DNG_07307 [Cephalotrichum gorgonifer]
MHFSVGKAVTVALMGFGNVLLITNAAPAGIVRARDPNVPDNSVPHYSDDIAALVVARSPKSGKGDSVPQSGWSDSSPESSDSETSTADSPNTAGFGMDGSNFGTTPADGPNPAGFGIPPPRDGSNTGSGSGSGNPPVAEGTVDLIGRGYDIHRTTAIDRSTNIEIRGDGGRPVVDMSVNAKGDSYTIKGAWNKYDETPNKPRLFEMVYSIWVNDMKREPGDLDTVRLLSVSEVTTRPVMDKAKEKKGGSTDITVTRSSEDDVDKEIFDELAETAWGKHVKKVLNLGGTGKEIESFRVQGSNLAVKVA